MILPRNQRFTPQPSLQAFKRNISNMTVFFQTAEFCWFFVTTSLIYLIHLFLPNLYFYSIISITIFLKVVNKVNFRVLTKPKLFLIIDLLPFAKFLELLAIYHGSSERRIILFLGCWNSPMFWLFYNLHGCDFPAVELDNAIQFTIHDVMVPVA